jgi:hypothetical protein
MNINIQTILETETKFIKGEYLTSPEIKKLLKFHKMLKEYFANSNKWQVAYSLMLINKLEDMLDRRKGGLD